MAKKAQAWGFDLIIASIIFTAGIIIFYIYSLNLSDNTEETLNTLIYEGNSVANNLLSEGSPKDWTLDNVQEIGIHSKDKVNETKLYFFYLLSETDYQRTKSLFNTEYNYYIFFPDPININGTLIEGIGRVPPLDSKNLIKITRLTVYKEKPAILSVDIWE